MIAMSDEFPIAMIFFFRIPFFCAFSVLLVGPTDCIGLLEHLPVRSCVFRFYYCILSAIIRIFAYLLSIFLDFLLSSLALSPIPFFDLFDCLFQLRFDSLHSTVSKVQGQGQGLTRPRWLVCWLVGGFLCSVCLFALLDLDSLVFLFLSLSLRIVNRDMLLYVDDFSGSLLCIGLSFLFYIGFCFYLYYIVSILNCLYRVLLAYNPFP